VSFTLVFSGKSICQFNSNYSSLAFCLNTGAMSSVLAFVSFLKQDIRTFKTLRSSDLLEALNRVSIRRKYEDARVCHEVKMSF
jgi:hypothetical protein